MPYVSANGEKVVSYRGLRGLTQEIVALRAGYSKRTIERIENSGRTQFTTIENIAEVLDVDPRELLLEPEDDLPAIVTVELDDEFFTSPEEAQQQLLREILKIVRQAGVIRVKKGSIILTLDMTRKDARLLQEAFAQGQLAHLGVRSVSFESPPIEWDEPKLAETRSPVAVIRQYSDSVAIGRPKQLTSEVNAALNTLVRRLWRPLLQRVQKRMSSASRVRLDAEDIMQNTFGRFCNVVASGNLKVASLDELHNLLEKIADSCWLDGMRHETAMKRSPSLEVDVPLVEDIAAPTPPDPAETAELHELLEGAFSTLTERERFVMHLHMQGFTRMEIAEHAIVLGWEIRPPGINNVLYRARKRIRQYLEEHGIEEP